MTPIEEMADLEAQGRNKKNEVPIWKKQNLTLEEAAEYSNIGINRLTNLIKSPECDFVLFIGNNKKLIKRKLFDKFVESVEHL